MGTEISLLLDHCKKNPGVWVLPGWDGDSIVRAIEQCMIKSTEDNVSLVPGRRAWVSLTAVEFHRLYNSMEPKKALEGRLRELNGYPPIQTD